VPVLALYNNITDVYSFKEIQAEKEPYSHVWRVAARTANILGRPLNHWDATSPAEDLCKRPHWVRLTDSHAITQFVFLTEQPAKMSPRYYETKKRWKEKLRSYFTTNNPTRPPKGGVHNVLRRLARSCCWHQKKMKHDVSSRGYTIRTFKGTIDLFVFFLQRRTQPSLIMAGSICILIRDGRKPWEALFSETFLIRNRARRIPPTGIASSCLPLEKIILMEGRGQGAGFKIILP
jgi:hypothetical protein